MNNKQKQLQENIFKFTIEGLVKYGYDIEEATKLVQESGLSRSIKISPDMINHCSQDQLVCMVIR